MNDSDDTAIHPGYSQQEPEEPTSRRRWPIVAVLVFLLVLVGGALGAYAYDNSKKDEIAEGVTAGGVDLGGLTEQQAKAKLHRKLVKPLRGGVRVNFSGDHWTLPGKRLKVRADVDRMVDRALEVSQEGGMPGRIVRNLTGGEVDEQIPSQVAYSQSAINRFVRHVAGEIGQEPQDASISPTAGTLEVVPGQNGRKIRDILLTKRLNAAVTRRGEGRTVEVKVRSTKPEVTMDEVAAQYPTYLTVSQSEFVVRLWKDLKLVKTYPIATGQPAYPTPYGLYSIQNKQVDPVWSVPNSDWAGELAGTVVAGGTAENPLKSRWMGVTDGVGFHGTSEDYSIGTQASHGCMRMHVSDVEDLYDRVPVGTPVYIG